MAEPHESRVYSDLAHLYDAIFGRVFVDHEHEVLGALNLRPEQKILEVGVGTGIALEAYPRYVQVVGIDPSQEMLEQAIGKSRENRWTHIELKRGDAQQLEFPDDSFDWVMNFHVMTVVPDPLRMMSEMVRVLKPGGRLVTVTHFASNNPVLFFLGSLVNPVTKLLGWTTRLRARDVVDGQPITVECLERLSRFSVHTLMVARKGS
jgi:phosphatidylethanolamine/phosphatidyl-N-methylethanolamine N-methyltransferase